MFRKRFQQSFDLLVRRCPACRNAGDGVRFVRFFPKRKTGFFRKPGVVFVFQNDKDLIGRGGEILPETVGIEECADFVCRADRVASDTEVQAVFKKRFKLNAQKPAFCKKCAVLFYRRYKMR